MCEGCWLESDIGTDVTRVRRVTGDYLHCCKCGEPAEGEALLVVGRLKDFPRCPERQYYAAS